MKVFFKFIALLCLCVSLCDCSHAPQSVLDIDMADEITDFPQDLWGIFIEEISRSGDGGLWPEMIYNMGFEEKDVPDDCVVIGDEVHGPAKPNYQSGQVKGYIFHHFDPQNKTEGWSLEPLASSTATMTVVSTNPVSKGNANNLRLDIKGSGARIINEGYAGLNMVSGDKYNFSFYARATAAYDGTVKASIIGKDGKEIFSQTFNLNKNGSWNKYDAVVESSVTDNKARLVMEFDGEGQLFIDYISLLPQETFMGHGLRKDIAQTLADIKPSFIRWPGGCIVEGLSMEDRIKWKETIGDRIERVGKMDLWGYHNSCSIGYHDFLQFCEDIGAEPMFVVNAGLSCVVRNGDYWELDEMDQLIQDHLDAIEYAIGDASTKWGAVRAKNGHPEPFHLKYIEIGNENSGEMYAKHYSYIYKRLKEKYPQIKYISTHDRLTPVPDTYEAGTVEMIDPHYYVRPEQFFNTTDVFDNAPRGLYEVYVGEYAVNSGVGPGTLEGALAEASFMLGIEKNSDLVKIASFAPILENTDFQMWPTNLIRFKNNIVVPRTSYHVQCMFSHNRPDVILGTKLALEQTALKLEGKTGFAASVNAEGSKVEMKDFSINGKATADGWEEQGSWDKTAEGYATGEFKDLNYLVEPNLYIPGTNKNVPPRLSSGGWVTSASEASGNFEVAAKVKFQNSLSSFGIRFAVQDDRNYLTFNVSAPRFRGPAPAAATAPKYTASVAMVEGNTNISLGTLSSDIELSADEWHDVKVAVNGAQITCFIDGKEIGSTEYKPLQKRYALAGYDSKSGEMIIKVVNALDEPFSTAINISNVASVESKGKVITLSSDSLYDENDFDNPDKIHPVESVYDKFSKSFNMTFKPNSFTILRVKVKAS